MDGLALLLGGLGLPALGGLGHLVQGGFALGLLVLGLIPEPVGGPGGGEPAVAHGGKEIVGRGEGEAFEDRGDDGLVHHVVQGQPVLAQGLLQHGAAALNVLLALFLLEPLLDLGAGRAALGHVEPVAAGAGGGL